MARRSPMNERYQKNTAPAGKTRKSAASAKPKRSSAEPKNPAARKSGASRPTNPMLVNPPTPEFKFWRRIWWVMLLSSLVLTVGSLAVRTYLQIPWLANGLLIAGYVGLFGALALDFTKIRQMRTAWLESQQGGKQGKDDK